MILPPTREKLVPWALKLSEDCRSSTYERTAMARSLKTWLYTGSPDGNSAILNRMFPHVDRMTSYLFSPNDLRFHIDFTHEYDKAVLDQAEVASRVLTRQFELRDIDIQFGESVFIALAYGACFPKLTMTHDGISCRLVMPWQLGVYRPDLNDLGSQEAICETNYITSYDLWRRISHLPNAAALFRRATAYAKRRTSAEDADTFFHQVLLAGTPPVVQTDPPFASQPGGLVQVTADPTGAILGPSVASELICLHEIWVLDDELGDYTTIQMAEPDILIAPQHRRKNFFIPDHLPYTMTQPNRMEGYFYGRSEMADLMKLQHLLRDRLEDIKKLMGLQYDRLLAIVGNSGMSDEQYDQFRQAGWMALEPGSDVKDLTPKMPEQAFADITEIMGFMDEVSGFQNILSGQGEPGVRAGNHAQTLLKTASPRLRDRAIIVERQCADLADTALQLMAHKEAKAYWTRDGSEFLLSQLPEDYRVSVDSHSSSPIYEEDHKEIAAFLLKSGVIDGESVLELLPVPMRDILKARFKEIQKAKAQQAQELLQHPELLKAMHGGKKH